MKDGTNKLVENIVKGDEVQTKINGIIGTSKVQCVIVTLCNNNKANMVTLGKLKLHINQ